ncbi:hypothetical protein L798_14100 [Zootermopsis nevadensis]|uniref:Uncharacterized protein n=1 Tax=Zootermopsis nevadensis TaxID=136037 RepID=A0A067R1T3_ZOONE|nr:hypothetical protein L798_14100 [Zootermopsis nevadensis]
MKLPLCTVAVVIKPINTAGRDCSAQGRAVSKFIHVSSVSLRPQLNTDVISPEDGCLMVCNGMQSGGSSPTFQGSVIIGAEGTSERTANLYLMVLQPRDSHLRTKNLRSYLVTPPLCNTPHLLLQT